MNDQICAFHNTRKAQSYIVTLYTKFGSEQKAEIWKQAAKHGIAELVWLSDIVGVAIRYCGCGYQILWVWLSDIVGVAIRYCGCGYRYCGCAILMCGHHN